MGQYLLTLMVQVTSITKDMILGGISGNYPEYSHWTLQYITLGRLTYVNTNLGDQML